MERKSHRAVKFTITSCGEMEEFSQKILTWYGTGRRELPWRDIRDPYRIWISEIILQQTRVAQGYDYYLRFIDRFPTVEALAEAEEDEVLRLWQGLGYYSRARNLHAAARSIAAAGRFPDTYEGVRALKGVGDYTAAAICSFAYGLPHAVVDGNVYRVLARHFGIDTPIDSTAGKKTFAQLAQLLLPSAAPGLYNQALMDFGALQCVPLSPRCEVCPLSESCMAWAEGRVAQLPVKSKRTAVSERHFVYVYARSAGNIWLRRRPSGDIWQGLYEPPLAEFDHRPCEEELSTHPLLAPMTAVAPLHLVRQGVKHVLTHRRIYADFYEAKLPAEWQMEGYIAVPEAERDNYAVPRLVEQLFEEMERLSER